jgi:hypothetical protein
MNEGWLPNVGVDPKLISFVYQELSPGSTNLIGSRYSVLYAGNFLGYVDARDAHTPFDYYDAGMQPEDKVTISASYRPDGNRALLDHIVLNGFYRTKGVGLEEALAGDPHVIYGALSGGAGGMAGLGGVGLPVGSGSMKSGVKTTEDYINLASPARTVHIVEGDANGGGHAWFGSFKSFKNGLLRKKSMFPMLWSRDKIMHAVSEIVTTNPWQQQTGAPGALFTKKGDPVRFVVEGVYEGVKIRVITTVDDIITAFPIK